MSFDLIHLNDGVSNEEVRAEMRRRRSVPAAQDHLKVFAEEAKLADAPDTLVIVALGTVLVGEDGREYVPALEWTGTGFQEAECVYGPGWFPNYRFLAVLSGDQNLSLSRQLAAVG